MVERAPDYELTPGALLRRSRQRYGWSVEDVADELKLLPYVVEAIEQDNYSQMAGWTYAVGYLRGYAKLVGVNIESAIAEHGSLLPQKEDGPGTLTFRTGARVAIPISLTWVVAAVVVIVGIGGISATYWKRANDSDRVVLESVTPEEKRTSAQILPEVPLGKTSAAESGELVAVSNGTYPRSIEQDSSNDQIPVVTLEPTKLGPEDDSNKQSAFNLNAEDSATAEVVVRPLTLADMDTRIIGSLPGVVVDDDAASAITLEDDRTASQSKIGTDTEQVAGEMGARDLVLFFDQGSWADIRDSRNQQLLRESVRAGATVRLKGDPPFTVFVGNARGVRYLYRGEENTAPAFGEGLFGRFQVGVGVSE
jgi:cytoskeleton protein RodZ